MNPAYKKIYTCTPVAFHANDGFYIRDTGLIASTLRTMGVESRCIMPLPYYEDDQREHLIRTEYRNLESADWWRSLGIDALVLYSWGAPRYRRIAYAVRKAGIRLVLHMDTSGDFVGAQPEDTPWWRILYLKLRVLAQDVLRARHMKQADVITMCPEAAKAVSHKLFYGKWVQEKCFPMSNPVSPACKYNGEEKKNLVMCVGRWDDEFQKRPAMLMATLERFYATPAEIVTRVYGTITSELQQWHAKLPLHVARQVELVGYLPNHELRKQYCQARVVLCTSRFEGSHISSCEGLCSGCSVVVPPRHEELRDVIWYASAQSGTVSDADTPESLAKALEKELGLWDSGARNPWNIASYWQPYFHADKVFNKIFE